ncbi:MAG TPA: DnaA regulatory inactivator Hda [Casimicrobiaceae bacterium]|nr:DnaA regulatory inactivator Hda [Casimicrobiaceae bacterium]
MREQLVFELVAPEPASFANFVPGRNGEAVAALGRAAAGTLAERSIVLWGASGAGKSHLLAACADAATRHGRRAFLWPSPSAIDPQAPLAAALVAVDDVDRADADGAARLFTLYNALGEHGGTFVAASALPPARIALRDDVRTRLSWGLVLEVVPLADDDKPAALAAYARSRGFTLADEVIVYLLAHGRRDMRSLVETLAALDRTSLVHKRPVTVPLVREWLQRSIDER